MTLDDLNSNYDAYEAGHEDGYYQGYSDAWADANNDFEMRIRKLIVELELLEARISVLAKKLP